MLPKHSCAATAAAQPPLEPPGTRSKSHGLLLRPNAEFSVELPIANSSMFNRPNSTAPASRSVRTTVPSYGERKSPRIFDEQLAGWPLAQNKSFSEIGTPSSG